MTVRLRPRVNSGAPGGEEEGAVERASATPSLPEVMGHGSSTDILEASARAYVQAINRLLAGDPRSRTPVEEVV